MSLRASPALQGANAPRVLTIPMIQACLEQDRRLPSRGALFNWIRRKMEEGALVRVSKGLYLNRQAYPPTAPEEAAGSIRFMAMVSLQKVLGDAGVTNNYTTVVTCVVPWELGRVPSVGTVKTDVAEFQFHSIPHRLFWAGREEDRLASGYWHFRATPERALLDWLRLGAQPRSSLAPPPIDVDLDLLDRGRLQRLAEAMGIAPLLESYIARVERTQQELDAIENGEAEWR